ncbi:MAG: transcription termination/antitermination factor NusG [Cytophagales bacterium]|nr:transcription termination/antitermination factor NusG [Cytophagales bacterium]
MVEGLHWYVMRIVAGQEKKVKAYLDTEISRQGYQEVIPEVLIPLEKVYEMRNGKKRVRERNFFPGYVLVYCDLSVNAEVVHFIKGTPGVMGFLEEKKGDGDSLIPVPLRQSEVNRILGRVDEVEEVDVQAEVDYNVGDSVKVMDGAFSGFSGTVQKVFVEKKKLDVIVKIFGRNTPVELNYMQVEKE